MASVYPTEFAVDIEACRRTFLDRERGRLAEREERRRKALEVVGAAIAKCGPRYDSARRIYLFGSATRPGALRPDSDVDVAVEGISASDYFALWRDLEREAPEWTIDLRDISGDSPFGERVRETGILVYERKSECPEG